MIILILTVQLGMALSQAGLIAFGHDHEGHGLSGGERVNPEDYSIYVDDVYDDIHQKRTEYLQE